MTLKAREVLDDVRGALAELVDGVQGDVWRRRWIITVVLLRSVGHVLDKVDAHRSAQHQKAIHQWWAGINRTKPVPEIFWLFIDLERHNIVKQYDINAGQGVTIVLPAITINLRTGEQDSGPPVAPIFHYTINSGHFQGREQRDLIREALQWWETQLDTIDSLLGPAAP